MPVMLKDAWGTLGAGCGWIVVGLMVGLCMILRVESPILTMRLRMACGACNSSRGVVSNQGLRTS